MGDSKYLAGLKEFVLTDAVGGQAGTINSDQRINLTQDFRLEFDIYLGSNDGGADGLAFVIHNDPSGANALGGAGGAMGVGGLENGLAIEFDTYFHGYEHTHGDAHG